MAKTKAAFAGVTFDADPVSDLVRVRVLKRGDGKISTGVHDNKGGDMLYEQGEEFEVLESVAKELEDRDFVEILKSRRAKPQLDHDNNGVPGGSVPAKED